MRINLTWHNQNTTKKIREIRNGEDQETVVQASKDFAVMSYHERPIITNKGQLNLIAQNKRGGLYHKILSRLRKARQQKKERDYKRELRYWGGVAERMFTKYPHHVKVLGAMLFCNAHGVRIDYQGQGSKWHDKGSLHKLLNPDAPITGGGYVPSEKKFSSKGDCQCVTCRTVYNTKDQSDCPACTANELNARYRERERLALIQYQGEMLARGFRVC